MTPRSGTSNEKRELLLSGLVVCRNEAPSIATCLASLAFCDELIVVDAFSDDGTDRIAATFTDRMHQRPYIGANDQKDFARRQARGRWVLNLDADEMIPPELASEIDAAIHSNTFEGYRIPVKTMVGDIWLRHGGMYPGYQKRLFLREKGSWDTSREPHDKVRLSGRWGKLAEAIQHRTAFDFDELEAKAIRYGRQAAARRGRPGTWHERAFHPGWRFVRTFLLRGGWLMGSVGWRLARVHYLEGKVKYAPDRSKSCP